MLTPLLYATCGLIVGALVGLTGVGGGSLMTPILVLAFGQSPAMAVGTDLMFSAGPKLVATASFGFSRRVDWRIVGRLVIGSVPAVAAVIAWLWLDHRSAGAIDEIISRCLAVILALAAAALVPALPPASASPASTPSVVATPGRVALLGNLYAAARPERDVGRMDPTASLSGALRTVGKIFPVEHLAAGLHSATIHAGFGSAISGTDLLILAAWGIAAAAFASWRFSWVPSTAAS